MLTSNGETITSVTGTSANSAVISISVVGTITAGKTYVDPTNSDTDDTTSALPSADDFINDDDISTSLPTVTITAVSAKFIQSTFSGNITNPLSIGTTSGTVKSLTSGKFNESF